MRPNLARLAYTRATVQALHLRFVRWPAKPSIEPVARALQRIVTQVRRYFFCLLLVPRCAPRPAGGRPKAAAAALRYCYTCPVLAECLDWRNGDVQQRRHPEIGVWAGVVTWHTGARIARLDLLGRRAS